MTLIQQLAEKAGVPYTDDLVAFAELVKAECVIACSDFDCGRTSSAEDLVDMHFSFQDNGTATVPDVGILTYQDYPVC